MSRNLITLVFLLVLTAAEAPAQTEALYQELPTNEVAQGAQRIPGSKNLGDLLYTLDAEAITGDIRCLGVENFGPDHEWWVSGGDDLQGSYLYKITYGGVLLASYATGKTGWGFRDLACDGQYLYASDSYVIEEIDPATGYVTGVTIPSPISPARALAYDTATDTFWTASFTSDIYQVWRDGSYTVYPNTPGYSIYGMAMDDVENMLWVWSQDGNGCLASEFDPQAGVFTGVTWDGHTGVAGVAGGACIFEDPTYGRVFAGMHQSSPDTIAAYELAPYDPSVYVPDDYGTIQAAIDAVPAGYTIRVKGGTYHENLVFPPKAITVEGVGTSYPTIDGGQAGSVVTFEENVGRDSVLKGFTITNGSATEGAGVTCPIGASPTIWDNIITGNQAGSHGGGIYCNNSSPAIRSNAISDNTAGLHGGGICVQNMSSPIISSNAISGNMASVEGGGLYVYYQCDTVVTGNQFVENSAGNLGGGVYILGDCATMISYNLFSANVADNSGGGFYSSQSTAFVMETNTFCGNSAANLGGGIYFENTAAVEVRNSLFAENSAGAGGGIANAVGDLKVVNATFWANSAVQDGGGIACAPPALVVNSILWGNTAPLGLQISGAAVVVRYCNIEGGWSGPGAHNLDTDPLFVNATGGDFNLQQDPCEPGVVNACVDAGHPASTMITGSTRSDGILDKGIVDLGYHYPVIVVPDAFTTIQEAIDAAQTGQRVIVKPGTYYEPRIDFLGKAITVQSQKGPDQTVIDGQGIDAVVRFSSGEGRDSVLDGFTITNGGGAYRGSGIYLHSSSPTIINNIITGNVGFDGGGIRCDVNSSPLIQDNRIVGNSAQGSGGGVYIRNDTEIIGNVISGNWAKGDGGGIYSEHSESIVGNTITGNSANRGGGVFVQGTSEFSGNVLAYNTAQGSFGIGGGVCFFFSPPYNFRDNILHDNTAETGGAIYVHSFITGYITNNTIYNNRALASTYHAGGLFCAAFTEVTVTNTIFWNNTQYGGSEIYVYGDLGVSAATLNISHSDVEGGQGAVYVGMSGTLNWGSGMIDADPLFVEPTRGKGAPGDFHLTYDSPCRDAGDNTAPQLPAEDFEGDPRIAIGTADIGADEFHLHLYHMGSPTPGGSVDIRVIGQPGTSPTTLVLGSGVQDPPQPTQYGDLYLVLPVIRKVNLGAIPSSGSLTKPAIVPSSWKPGEKFPFQVLAGPQAPGSQLTNLMLLEIE